MVERIEMPADVLGFRISGEDLKTGFDYGIGHRSAWKRMALVTDVEWIRHAAALFGWMAPGEMKTFALAEADQARTWVTG